MSIDKHLEGSKFVRPHVRKGAVLMSLAPFAVLLEGLEWRLVWPEGERRPQFAG